MLRALRAGAAGFLLKDTPGSDQDTRQAAARRRLGALADRERAVAVEIGSGRSNAEIAARYHLGLTTVKTHVSAILTKLDLNNRVQVALLVQEAGLEDPERSG